MTREPTITGITKITSYPPRWNVILPEGLVHEISTAELLSFTRFRRAAFEQLGVMFTAPKTKWLELVATAPLGERKPL